MPAVSSSGSTGSREAARPGAAAGDGGQAFDRRLPLYAYLEPLLTGRRVLEIGCGTGAGADYLAARSAARVLSVDTDPSVVERARLRYRRSNLELRTMPSLADIKLGELSERFDVVLVPEGEGLLRRGLGEVMAGEVQPAVLAWRRCLADSGRLIVVASSADRPGRAAAAGLGYYEIADGLAPH